jgi:thiol:disulfide interchange protein
LKDFSNIHVGQDSANIFLKSFKATGLPFNTVFSAQKRLKKAITGEIDAATLAKTLVSLADPAP